MAFNHQIGVSTNGKKDYTVLTSTESGSTTGIYTQIRWHGSSVPAERTTISSHPSKVTYIPAGVNGGIYDVLGDFQFWVNSEKSAIFTFYGFDIDETITYCDEKFNIGANGSAYINSYADIDGKNAISNKNISDGETVPFEMNTQPVLMAVADTGYVIDTLTYNGTEITEASGKVSYKFTSDKIKDAGNFDITFKKNEETAVNYDRISLSANTTLYKNTAREASPVIVTAYDSEGVETDITGSAFLTYSTSNPLAFALSGNMLSTGSINGMSIVTATYKRADNTEIKASVIFQNTKNITTASDKADVTVNGVKQTFDFRIDEPGHASESCLAWNADNAAVDSYRLRAYYGSNVDTETNGGYDWSDGKYRLASGWFYDDGTNANYLILFLKNLRPDARTKSAAFNHSVNIGKTSATDKNYGPWNKGDGVKATKGWHQAVAFVDNSGYVNVYIDGVLVYRLIMPVSDQKNVNDYSSYIEFRAVRGDTSKASFKFDDLYIADYTNVKSEYTATISMPEENNLFANGNYAKNASEVKVNAGGSVSFETKAPDKTISTIEKIDALGFNSRTYIVNAKSYTVSDINDDAEYKVNFKTIDGVTAVEKEVFYEDFKGKALSGNDGAYANIATTDRGRRLKIRAGVGVAYDAENGYVTYAKASKTAEVTSPPHAYFSISNENGSKLFTYYLGRSYRYEFVAKGAAQNVYMQNATGINGEHWGANINPTINSEDFAKISSTLNIYSISGDNEKTWTAKSKNVDSLESITFTDSPRTYSEIKVTEIKYCIPVTLTKTGSGTVSYTEADDTAVTMTDGSNSVEGGERTFTFTPSEGYKIESVEFAGSPIVVTNEEGFTAALTVDDVKELKVTFAAKPETAPTITAGEPSVASNYRYSEDYEPSNTIVGYATIDAGYGKTISECGYYITNKDGIKLTLPAVAIPTGTTYGIRMFGAALVSGEYKIQPYIKLSDDTVIAGEEKSVIIE